MQQGSRQFSYKSEIGWGGMNTQTANAPLQFELLENAYVSSDGQEIRPFPGYVCVIDPVSDARLYSDTSPLTGVSGYEADHIDARRPSFATSGSYNFHKAYDSGTDEQLIIWTRPTTLHSVHYIGNRWTFVGESDGRREPIFNAARTAYVYVTSYQGDGAGTSFDITLNTAPANSSTTFNAIAAGFFVYFEGLTGDHAAILNGITHLVTNVAGAVVTIATDYTGSHAAFTGQTGFISKVASNPADHLTDAGTATIGDDLESLTVWRSAVNIADVVTPGDTLYCSHVANRQRDFGDATGNVRQGNSVAGSDQSRRRQLGLSYRCVPHLAGNRLILASPGYSVVFQVPYVVPTDISGTSSGDGGISVVSNGLLDKPRALGVPKAIVWEDPDKAVANNVNVYNAVADATVSFGGSNAAVSARAGVYKFKFAYKDDATGEIGLCSESVSVTTDTAAFGYEGIQFAVYFPGYLMPECLATSIIVYRTALNGETFYYDETIPLTGMQNSTTPLAESGKYGLTPSADSGVYYLHVHYKARYKTDAELIESSGDTVIPETVQQMPMGCKAAYTYRGFTIFGGALGNSGPRREMQSGTIKLAYSRVASGVNAIYYNPDEVISLYSTSGTALYKPFSFGFGFGGGSIPSAYAGQTIFSSYLFPYPRQTVVIDRVINTVMGSSAFPGTSLAFIPDVRYRILETPVDVKVDLNTSQQTSYLLLPRGRLQISMPDNPGQTPATQTTVLANEDDEDVEALGSMGGQPIVCTKTKTYMVGFSGSPVNAPAEIAHSKFGCIAPNSMVEFDGGCAWISDRGPVAFQGGTVDWIGAPLAKYFLGETSRYKRDSLGMMRHAWGCHDAERGLIYFGLYADRYAGLSTAPVVNFRGVDYTWTTNSLVGDTNTDNTGSRTADMVRSRFPCDEVLVYSYRTRTWSVWRPPSCINIQWMTSGADTNKQQRVFFLGDDKRLYALDDLYGQFSRESNYTSIAQTGETTTITGLTTGITMRAGMDVLFYKGGSGTELTFLGLRSVASTTSSSITLDSSITLPVGGCKMIVGPKRMKLRTTWANWKDSLPSDIGRLGMRFSTWSRYSTSEGAQGSAQAAFASATATTAAKQDGYVTRIPSTLTGGSYSPISEDMAGVQSFHYDLDQGFSRGQGTQIELDVIGGTQLRLHDLFANIA